MNQIKSIMALAKDSKVIYVEDDPQTQRAMGEILKSFFGHVYIGSNGQEGLELFEKHPADLIISDINMPKMNGIEMITAIRSVNAEIPIMIISAYNDKEYLLDSIFLGIDRYVTKPLKDDEFFKNLHVMLKNIQQKREALEYQKERITNQINETAMQTLKETTDIYPSPTFVFRADGRLEFMNSAASRIFGKEELGCLLEGECLNKFIIPRDGYLKSVEEVRNPSSNGSKLILKTSRNVRIFLVTCSTIKGQVETLEAVSLTDITRVEYEKQKSQNLSAYLHDLLRSLRRNMAEDIAKEVSQKGQNHVDVSPQDLSIVSPREDIVQESKESSKEKSYDYIRLNAMHPVHKESAREYVLNLSAEIVDELDEMEELEGEMKDVLIEMEEHFSLSSVHSLAGIYARYGRMIALLMDFEDVSYSILNLSEFLLTLATTEWNQKKMFILLQSISEDLMQWRQMVFVTQEANDIHYLDASLLSSCLQIKMDFGGGEDGEEENELELF